MRGWQAATGRAEIKCGGRRTLASLFCCQKKQTEDRTPRHCSTPGHLGRMMQSSCVLSTKPPRAGQQAAVVAGGTGGACAAEQQCVSQGCQGCPRSPAVWLGPCEMARRGTVFETQPRGGNYCSSDTHLSCILVGRASAWQEGGIVPVPSSALRRDGGCTAACLSGCQTTAGAEAGLRPQSWGRCTACGSFSGKEMFWKQYATMYGSSFVVPCSSPFTSCVSTIRRYKPFPAP